MHEENIRGNLFIKCMENKIKYNPDRSPLTVYMNILVWWVIKDYLRDEYTEDLTVCLDQEPADSSFQSEIETSLDWDWVERKARRIHRTPREKTITGNVNAIFLRMKFLGYRNREIAARLHMPESFTMMLSIKLRQVYAPILNPSFKTKSRHHPIRLKKSRIRSSTNVWYPLTPSKENV